MRYTRRRYDLLIAIGGVAIAAAAVAAELLVQGRITLRVLASLLPIGFLFALRHRIPPQGWEDAGLSDRPPAERRLLRWCVFWLIAHLCALPLAACTKNYWWAWAIWTVLLMTATLRLAWRADRERQGLRSKTATTG